MSSAISRSVNTASGVPAPSSLAQDGEAVLLLPDGPRAGVLGFRERRAAPVAVGEAIEEVGIEDAGRIFRAAHGHASLRGQAPAAGASRCRGRLG